MQRKRILALFIVLFAFGIVFLVISSVTYGSYVTKFNDNGKTNDYQSYRHSQKNSKNGDKHFRISKFRESGQTYVDNTRNNKIDSTFGLDDYECSGSCYCEDVEDDWGRRTAIPMVRGLKYLVGSLSALVAFEVSKSYFEGECVKELEDLCSPESIRGEVESCEEVHTLSEVIMDTEEKSDTKEIESQQSSEGEKEEKKDTRFFCEGTCVPTGMSWREYWEASYINFFSDLSFYERNEFLMMFGRTYLANSCKDTRYKGEVYASDQYLAMELFAKRDLHPKCRSVDALFLHPSKGTEYKKEFCAGYVLDGNRVKRIDVNCRTIGVVVDNRKKD